MVKFHMSVVLDLSAPRSSEGTVPLVFLSSTCFVMLLKTFLWLLSGTLFGNRVRNFGEQFRSLLAFPP